MARVERRDGWWGIVEAGMTAGAASAARGNAAAECPSLPDFTATSLFRVKGRNFPYPPSCVPFSALGRRAWGQPVANKAMPPLAACRRFWQYLGKMAEKGTPWRDNLPKTCENDTIGMDPVTH